MGVPAKGLTGHGYEGHYFWDTEIYVLPFLIYTSPHVARNLLRFRYRMLDAARARAREVNQQGALFPWRTINGEEASAYYAAGHGPVPHQRGHHLCPDEVRGRHGRHRVPASGRRGDADRDGADVAKPGILLERANGQFCINGVTGPDEYNTVVNNNAFTNLMARENLWAAARTLEQIRASNPERFAELAHDTGLNDSEIAEWQAAADRMYVPVRRDRRESIFRTTSS